MLIHPENVAADPCCPAEPSDKVYSLSEAPLIYVVPAELTARRDLHSPTGNITASYTLLLRHSPICELVLMPSYSIVQNKLETERII
jgi:hypothetical protein